MSKCLVSVRHEDHSCRPESIGEAVDLDGAAGNPVESDTSALFSINCFASESIITAPGEDATSRTLVCH